MEIHRKDGEIESRPKSIGGKVFDWITYGGIAGVGTFIVTLPLAYWQKYTPGRKFYHTASDALQRIGVSEKIAVNATETTNLMHGGNLMLLPVLGLEYFRTPIVTGLNRLFNDPTDPESVKDAPKQTVGSVLKGRLLAWTAVFVGFTGASKIIPGQMQAFENKVGEMTCKIFKQPVIAESKAYRYGQIGALDAFATITAATLLYTGSHFFAQRRQHRTHDKIKKSAEQPPAAIADSLKSEIKNESPQTTITSVIPNGHLNQPLGKEMAV